MTDNEIIKALECCVPSYTKKCDKCVYEQYKSTVLGKPLCSEYMRKDTLDLINRLQSKLYEQAELYEQAKQEYTDCMSCKRQVKAETLSEVNARLYAYKTDIYIKGEELIIIPSTDYEQILKELVGE